MVTTCIVCGYRSVKGDGTKTHHFPPDASLRAQWLSACRLDSVASADRLCGKHFHVDDYKLDSGRLKPGAIPSVFLSSPESRKRPRERSFNVSSSSSSDDSIVSEDGSFSSVKRRKLQASPSKDDLKQKIVEQKRKIKSLNQKLRRKCEKIETLEGMYKELSDRKLLKDEFAEQLKEKFPGMSAEVIANHFDNFGKDSRGFRHSDDAKKFALTLHFYSPRAYDFVRQCRLYVLRSMVFTYTWSQM